MMVTVITEPQQLRELMHAISRYTGHPCTLAALELSVLVFVSPGELMTAEWAEINLDRAEWRIPGSKTKTGVVHIVPLSDQAMGILEKVHLISGHGRYVFPSSYTGKRPMRDNTIDKALQEVGYEKQTHVAHGFRAMAHTFLIRVLGSSVALAEHQLGYPFRETSGRPPKQTARLPARREMMQRWADYLDHLQYGIATDQEDAYAR